MPIREVFFVNDPNKNVAFWSNPTPYPYTKQSRNLFIVRDTAEQNNTKPKKKDDYTLFRESLYRFSACYSRGDAIEELRTYFLETVLGHLFQYQQSPNYQAFDFKDYQSYLEAIWTVSLAILFNCDQAIIKKIESIIGQKGTSTFLDQLIQPTAEIELPIQSTFPIPNDALLALLLLDKTDDFQTNGLQLVEDFLLRYYDSIADLWWYDTHIEGEARFFGYWAWELAAVVLRSGLNDLPFANHIFYPRDLLNKKLYRTWEDSEAGDNDLQAHTAALEAHEEQDFNALITQMNEQIISTFEGVEGQLDAVFQELVEKDIIKEDAANNDAIIADQLLLIFENLCQSVIDYQPSQEDQESLYTTTNAFQEALQEEAIDMADLEKEFLTLLNLASLEEIDWQGIQQKQQEKLKKIGKQIKELRLDQTISADDKLEQLQNYMVEAGFMDAEAVRQTDVDPTIIQKEFQADLRKSLDERRAGKEMVDFDFDDLWGD